LALEKQLQVAAPAISTTDAYKQAVHMKLGVHVVDTINNEVICAGWDASNNQVLLHCRVEAAGNLFFTIKTSQQATLNDLSARLPAMMTQASPPAASSNPLDGLF